nr:hypothetical protein [uncultured archaeon]
MKNKIRIPRKLKKQFHFEFKCKVSCFLNDIREPISKHGKYVFFVGSCEIPKPKQNYA